MKVNTWITGIHLHEYTTDKADGHIIGWDADFGEMVAYKGKLIALIDLPKGIVVINPDSTIRSITSGLPTIPEGYSELEQQFG